MRVIARAFKCKVAGLLALAALLNLEAKETCSITMPPANAYKAICQTELGLCVSNAYALPTPPKAANGAVFMELVSKSEETLSILGASSNASEAVELHTTEHENGVMKMLQLPSLSIAPKQSETLKPKGKHFMLIGLTKPLKVGESLTLTLQVRIQAKNAANSKEQSLTLTIPVREASECTESSAKSTLESTPDSELHAHHH